MKNLSIYEQKLEELKAVHPNCICDGIVNEELFKKAVPKVLWILKEVHGSKDDDHWDLRDFLTTGGKLLKYSGWKRTFGLVVKVSYSILNGFPEYSVVSKDIEEKSRILEHVAVINVSKLPGGGTNYYPNLEKAYQKFRDLLLFQVRHIDADIVIGGYTLPLFYNDLGLDDSMFNKDNPISYYLIKDEKLWIHTNHPNARVGHEAYINSIKAAVLAWQKVRDEKRNG